MKKSSLAIISSGVLIGMATIVALVNKLNGFELIVTLVLILFLVLIICATYCIVALHTNNTNRKIAESQSAHNTKIVENLSKVATNETDKQHEYNMKALEKDAPSDSSPTPTALKTKEYFMKKCGESLFENKSLETSEEPTHEKEKSSSPTNKLPRIIRIK